MKTGVLRKGAEVVVGQVEVASTLWARAIGLLRRGSLPSGHGMLLTGCGSIHTCFMRFSLDLIFFDTDWTVVKVVRDVKPWRVVSGGRRAKRVLEVQAGWLAGSDVGEGDHLTLVEAPSRGQTVSRRD